MKTALVLLSHYGNTREVESFVRQVLAIAHGNLWIQIAIADNSGDLPADRFPPQVSIHRAPGNLGYLPGCAWAFERWLSDYRTLPHWVVVANSDMTLQPDFLETLDSLEVADDVGIVAPDILLPGGARQNPLLSRRPLKLVMGSYAVLARFSLFSVAFELWVRARHRVRGLRPTPVARPSRIYAPHGSLVLFHRRFFERGGTLRYGACMYGEEIHIAEQARRARLRVVWSGDLVADHFEHSTTALVPAPQRTQWRAESAVVLWNEYFRDGIAA